MPLRSKLRLGALILLVGAVLAAVGELLTLWNTDPMTSNWFVSMGLITFGTLALLYGITTYGQLSQEIALLGLSGTGLLALGGLALILGTIVLNMVLVPLLLSMAAAITTVINAPGSAVQGPINSLIARLNQLESIIGGRSLIPSVKIPQADGVQIISSMLNRLHLPTIAVLSQWGHFFSSGGPLTFGCLLLGFALLKAASFPRVTAYGLMIAAGLNLLCQVLSLAPILPIAIGTPWLAITGCVLFASLALLGTSILSPQEVSRLWSAGVRQKQ